MCNIYVYNIHIHTYKHLHAITISEKRGQQFEGECSGVSGRIWREEKERIVIIFLKYYLCGKQTNIILKVQMQN